MRLQETAPAVANSGVGVKLIFFRKKVNTVMTFFSFPYVFEKFITIIKTLRNTNIILRAFLCKLCFISGEACQNLDCPGTPDCNGVPHTCVLENGKTLCTNCSYPYMGDECEFKCYNGTAKKSSAVRHNFLAISF